MCMNKSSKIAMMSSGWMHSSGSRGAADVADAADLEEGDDCAGFKRVAAAISSAAEPAAAMIIDELLGGAIVLLYCIHSFKDKEDKIKNNDDLNGNKKIECLLLFDIYRN